MRIRTQALVAVVLAGLGGIEPAAAQSLGPITWQLTPFCNRVTVQVTQNGAVYTMDGFDDQCAGGVPRAPVVGVATPNPDGSIGFGWTVVTVPGGKPVHVDARIDLTTIGGPWTDSAGNSGTLVLGGNGAGSPRPAPSGAAPGSVTSAALAPGAVTSAAIADATIGAADIDPTQIQRRLTGAPCASGTFMVGALTSGSIGCATGASGVLNTALGQSALRAITTGTSNSAVGDEALRDNLTGVANTAVGVRALRLTSTGGLNVAIGSDALAKSNGSFNVAVGSAALFGDATGSFNVAVGVSALEENQGSSGNVAVGVDALRDGVTTGGNNTAVGREALRATTGGGNVAVGRGAGRLVTTGFNNIHLWHNGDAADTATIRIGAQGIQTRAFLAGVRGVTVATGIPVIVGTDGQLGTTTSSRRFKEDIADMGDISGRLFALRPVTFRYSQPAADGSKPLDFGLIAEEVAEVFPELAVRGGDGQIETVAYHKLPALLLNELQRQQRTIDTLLERVRALEATRDPR